MLHKIKSLLIIIIIVNTIWSHPLDVVHGDESHYHEFETPVDVDHLYGSGAIGGYNFFEFPKSYPNGYLFSETQSNRNGDWNPHTYFGAIGTGFENVQPVQPDFTWIPPPPKYDIPYIPDVVTNRNNPKQSGVVTSSPEVSTIESSDAKASSIPQITTENNLPKSVKAETMAGISESATTGSGKPTKSLSPNPNTVKNPPMAGISELSTTESGKTTKSLSPSTTAVKTPPTSDGKPSNTDSKTTIRSVEEDEEGTSELSLLSLFHTDLSTGQKIPSEMSKTADTKDSNSAGVEIMKNVSKICGSSLGKRVAFGVPTSLLEYPWTTLLIYDTKDRYQCGGSLITDRYVLTAAHCVSQAFFPLIGVRFGEHEIDKKDDCAELLGGDVLCKRTLEIKVEKIIIHNEYSNRLHKNDIALLRLAETVEFTKHYYPICLPTPDDNRLDTLKEATVAGWGATETVIQSKLLLKAQIPLLNMSKCREVYTYTKFNDDTEICGSGANQTDVCRGDSGGAMFVYVSSGGNSRSKNIQLGIVSLGVARCGDPRFLPAIFTKLPAYHKWIENNLEY